MITPINLPREKTVIILTVQNLINDGWEFIRNENDKIIQAENKNDEELINFTNEKEIIAWILNKAMDY